MDGERFDGCERGQYSALRLAFLLFILVAGFATGLRYSLSEANIEDADVGLVVSDD